MVNTLRAWIGPGESRGKPMKVVFAGRRADLRQVGPALGAARYLGVLEGPPPPRIGEEGRGSTLGRLT